MSLTGRPRACESLESRLLLTGVPNLTDADVGSPGTAGSAAYNASTGAWTVRGGGDDIWNNADQFNFASRLLSGDGTVLARVNSQTNTSDYAKAGVMLRADPSAGSAFAGLFVTPSNGLIFEWRPSAGAATSGVNIPNVAGPVWLKLARTGGTFTASYSADGTIWQPVAPAQLVTIGTAALAGLAVTSHTPAAVATATFTSLTVAAAPAVSSLRVNDGSAQRSEVKNLTVTFTAPSRSKAAPSP